MKSKCNAVKCLLVGLIISGSAVAAAPTPAPVPKVKNMTAAEVNAVKPLLVKYDLADAVAYRQMSNGIIEVALSPKAFVYVDLKHGLIYSGESVDMDSRVNLTKVQSANLSKVNWKDLPLDLAIKTVKGNGANKIAVFSDPDCPYCRKFETNAAGLDNVTIYTFPLPLAQLHPDATRKSLQIICAKDPSVAWGNWWSLNELPSNKGDCKDAVKIEKIAKLAEKLGISATPSLVFENGTVIPGAVDRSVMEAEFKKK
jgi:thiol:disulfide interchange protein DsbC